MRDPRTNLRIMQELNIATRAKGWSFFWAIIGTIIVSASMIGRKGFGLSIDLFTVLFLLGLTVVISASYFLNEAWWNKREIDMCNGTGEQETAEVMNDPSDALTFNQDMNPSGRVENQTSTFTLSRCKWQFKDYEWKRLVDSLVYYSDRKGQWKWTKKVLIKANLFTAELTPDVNINNSADYPIICKEFGRLDIIAGGMGNWVVTSDGRIELSRKAGLNVIPARG